MNLTRTHWALSLTIGVGVVTGNLAGHMLIQAGMAAGVAAMWFYTLCPVFVAVVILSTSLRQRLTWPYQLLLCQLPPAIISSWNAWWLYANWPSFHDYSGATPFSDSWPLFVFGGVCSSIVFVAMYVVDWMRRPS